ncbi:MAG: hypothetical protein FJ006_12500 [Chloroflexi bacterium]|nr:hypothetical protein [Chloroflexota bacterium]
MSSASEQQILGWLERVEKKLDNIILNGCSKVSEHTEVKTSHFKLEERVRELETSRNENRGKLIVTMMIVGAVISYIVSAVFQYIGKTFPQ